MIEFRQGDILRAEVEALVNTVNCVGVMGRGIALQFRKQYPTNYKVYRAACQRNELQPGTVLVHDLELMQGPRFVINFPTKRHWKGKSRIEDIRAGLVSLVREVEQRRIKSIAIPALGCGLGGLAWRTVRPLIETAFYSVPNVLVLIYEPSGAPAAAQMPTAKKPPQMTAGRAALLGLMRRYLAGVMDPSISLLEIHKLMYFMQESGEPLNLAYTKAHYGPYSENLRHVLSVIEGHFISGYGDGEDRPDRQIELRPDAAEQAEAFLKDNPATRDRFNRVVNLIDGFETAYGMELLATVHWVATREGASEISKAISSVYAWNERKSMFKDQHIRIAFDLLRQKGWLTLNVST